MKYIKKAYVGLILLIMYAPVAILMVYSFNDSKLPIWKGFTFRWYEEIFQDASIQQAFYNTIFIAVVSSVVATIIGTLAAMGIERMTGWKKKLVMNITYIPLLSSEIVTGVSLMLLFSALKIPVGILTLILAHITFSIPYVILSIMPKLKQLNYNIYEAALDLGATPRYAFKKVVLPEILPGVLAGLFIAFTLSIDDFIISFFNTGPGVDTLSIKVFAMTRKGVAPTINAISTIMFATIIIILIASNVFSSKKQKKVKEGQEVEVRETRQPSRFRTTKIIAAVLVAGIAVMLYVGGTGVSKQQQVVNVFNWGDYIDPDVNKEFEEETGIKVIYSEFATNEEMYQRLEPGNVSYDVAVPSDYMIEKMLNNDMLEKIDTSQLENYSKIDDRFKDLPYDPTNEYSLPYMWGTVGIVYNTTMVDEEVDSWDILWDPKYAGKIFMYDSEREGIMAALKKLGYSMNTRDPKELEEAKQELIKQAPLVLSYVGDEGKGKMVSGEAALMISWAGDAMVMIEENPDLAFALPKEGTNFFVDGIVIPKGAKNIENAYKYIDFLCRPDIAARNAEYIGYSTPLSEARALLPEEIRDSEVAYPSEEETDRMEMFTDPSDVIKLYSSIWMEAKSSASK
ncbi:extracellular solute-binding protein [Niameybacter massiliensis]|uniref:Extracellular solute-binding protein n=1 Tax=Holtiella tumoricola TaxID=3018743 RepID=A0AA42DNA4_9FIRM|nr:MULTISPECIES: extracellular solute-binding protein [Lachnospirales]MDA3732160.1 extracellular solute-binding protein [Holtiella tumoricola]